MKWIVGYLAAICVLLLVVSQSIFIPTFHSMPFFRWQFDMRGVSQTIGVEKEELMAVTVELLDYMRGRRDELYSIYATVNGEYRQFFSDIEIRHMIDVYDLYRVGFVIRNISFFLLIFLILTMAYFQFPILTTLARCSREVLALFLLLLVLLAGVIAWDFDHSFEMFHLMFFDNDYWILDPRVDLLINMVPQGFFIHISIYIGLLLILFSAVIIVVSSLYLHYSVPRVITTRSAARRY